jgi:F-type H+-transporting ATPase subunit alpha
MSQTSVHIAEELIKSIEARIDSADLSPERVSAGVVSYLGDGIAKVVGLRGVAYNEVVDFESGARGVAMNLEEHSV